MNDIPRISIIVPVYNGGAQFEKCLRALLQSTFTSYELIVVDNGSTDKSVAIAKRHGARILHCPGPSGPGAARNVGAEHAKADILLFIDADVLVHADTVERVFADFEKAPEIAAVFGSYDDSPSAQNFLSQYKNLLHHFVHQQGASEAVTFWGGCGAIRTEVFKKLGGFDTEKYPNPSIEDIELGFRMHELGYRILLDKQLQAKHLKEWRWGSLLRAEIFYRAIPWAKLMLETQGIVNDLNLKVSQRVSAGLVGLVILIAALIPLAPVLGYGLIGMLGMIYVLNWKLFTFFWRRRGWNFATLAFPMHLLYYCYSSAAFVWCWGVHCLGRKG